MRLLRERQPASLRVMTLLDKPDRREIEIQVDWVGFSIPNEFVVGYGLDFNELYRNLPFVGVLKPSIYGAPE
jgi:hypoxanthine phosphoribosyltransferase